MIRCCHSAINYFEVLKLNPTIVFAGPEDEEELRSILTETGMDLAGEAEDHILLKQQDRILAGGMLYQAEEDLFHLMVFAVSKEERGRSTGRRLLQELDSRPWKYSRDAMEPTADAYQITTIAKGEVALFYKKCGYQACDFSRLPDPFGRQCEQCPDQEDCNPVPMVFVGMKPGTLSAEGGQR
jgi:N-acetylglutamate synthase-like GNAT family acetyltransferase